MFHNQLIKKPKDLENYVQYVYSTLLNLKDEGVVVSCNAVLVGKSGSKHEIDVFYQFEKSGITHKVAFECKFTKRKVEKSQLIDFHGKIQDIGNIQGIFVCKNGYQEGAMQYATHYGIKLLTIDELPTLNILISKRIESVALPNINYIGEPFWVLMEVSKSQLTGSYWARKEDVENKEEYIPLFIAKHDAIEFLSCLPDKNNFEVRGLPQHSLRFLLKTAGIAKGRVKFALMLDGADIYGRWPSVIVTHEDVENRFLIKKE